MGIFDFFRKAKPGAGRPPKQGKPFTGDKVDYQRDSAAEAYCQQLHKPLNAQTLEALEAEEYDVIDQYAANHIAFFLVWVVQNGFYNGDDAVMLEVAEAVKQEQMTGAEFLLQYCDGVLCREDLRPALLGFADTYYDPDYLRAYTAFVEDTLHKSVPGIAFSWDDYHQFRPILDQAYQTYLAQK